MRFLTVFEKGVVGYMLHRSRNDKHEPEHNEKYRTLRNKVHNKIRSAERQYMIDKIDENKDNSKQLWKHVKDLGYQSKSKESANIVLDVDGKKYHDKKAVADHFNQFFTQIASKLVSKLPRQEYMTYDVDSVKFKNPYKDIMPDSFKFQEISEEFVLKEFQSLNISKSSLLHGLDSIPARFIKDAAEVTL